MKQLTGIFHSTVLLTFLFLAAAPAISAAGSSSVREKNPNCQADPIRKVSVLLPRALVEGILLDQYNLALEQQHPNSAPISPEELDLTCGEGAWLVVFEEDENGVIPGTEEVECLTPAEM